MPVGTCDPASRGEASNAVTIEERAPDGTGGILVDVRFGWNGTSVRPNCDGPVSSIRARNTSGQPAWASLPLKKRGDTWIQLAPGTDVTTTSQGQLRNLGLENYSDVAGVALTFTQPV